MKCIARWLGCHLASTVSPRSISSAGCACSDITCNVSNVWERVKKYKKSVVLPMTVVTCAVFIYCKCHPGQCTCTRMFARPPIIKSARCGVLLETLEMGHTTTRRKCAQCYISRERTTRKRKIESTLLSHIPASFQLLTMPNHLFARPTHNIIYMCIRWQHVLWARRGRLPMTSSGWVIETLIKNHSSPTNILITCLALLYSSD